MFAILVAICVSDAERKLPGRRLLALLPLLAVWANMHGSILPGAAVASGYLIFRTTAMARRKLWRHTCWYAVLAIACPLAIFATPYGLQVVQYYTWLFGNAAVAAAAPDWRPPAIPSVALILFVIPLLLALVSVTVQLVKTRRASWLLVAATAATALATVDASRNSVWFAMTAVLLIADSARS
jgi:hypothetical protein